MNLHPTLDDVVEALSDAQFAVGCYLSQQETTAPGYAVVFRADNALDRIIGEIESEVS
jgi:hypothetical protein